MSRSCMSLVKRLRMRPTGVVSKKLMGDATTAFSMRACRLRELFKLNTVNVMLRPAATTAKTAPADSNTPGERRSAILPPYNRSSPQI
eukprot:2021444-Pyramimonas_sp.AAC.1